MAVARWAKRLIATFNSSIAASAFATMPRATALSLRVGQAHIATDLLKIYDLCALRLSVGGNEQQSSTKRYQKRDSLHCSDPLD
jgi:hypothetical protein